MIGMKMNFIKVGDERSRNVCLEDIHKCPVYGNIHWPYVIVVMIAR